MKILNKRTLIGVFFALVCVIALSGIIFQVANKQKEIRDPVDKVLRFTYTLTNTSSELIPHATFETYLPLDIDGFQSVKNIISSHEYERASENGKTNTIKYQLNNFPPFGSRVISLTVTLQHSRHPLQESIDKKLYLKSEKYIETDSQTIRSVVNGFNDRENKQKASFEWLANNITDVGYVAENKGAQYALENRAGDCTEHMYAFVALSRATNTPARGVAGFVVDNAGEIIDSSKYHNWAEYYDGKSWILVDSQKRVFDTYYENYIPYRFFGGESETHVSANRFLATDKRISIQF